MEQWELSSATGIYWYNHFEAIWENPKKCRGVPGYNRTCSIAIAVMEQYARPSAEKKYKMWYLPTVESIQQLK